MTVTQSIQMKWLVTLKPNGSCTGTVTPLRESSDAIINQAAVERANRPDDIRNKGTRF